MPKPYRVFTGALIAGALSIALTACGGGGGNVITVNGEGITHAQLDAKLEDSPAAKQTLQQMVVNRLIDQYAQKNHITISDAQIDKVEDGYKKNYPAGQWDAMLKMRGFTEQQVRDLIRRQLVIDKAVGGDVTISQKQIADYFAKNHTQFDQPAEACARHILVQTLDTANKVEQLLKHGKDFAALAKEYSQDPGSRDKGGELGCFRMGMMVPSFQAYAFSAPIGKISEPVKSQFGYHIIQVEKRIPAKKATLAGEESTIRDTLRQQQEAPLIQPFIQKLESEANIQVNDSTFDGLFPQATPASAAPSAAPTVAATSVPSAAPTKK